MFLLYRCDYYSIKLRINFLTNPNSLAAESLEYTDTEFAIKLRPIRFIFPAVTETSSGKKISRLFVDFLSLTREAIHFTGRFDHAIQAASFASRERELV